MWVKFLFKGLGGKQCTDWPTARVVLFLKLFSLRFVEPFVLHLGLALGLAVTAVIFGLTKCFSHHFLLRTFDRSLWGVMGTKTEKYQLHSAHQCPFSFILTISFFCRFISFMPWYLDMDIISGRDVASARRSNGI